MKKSKKFLSVLCAVCMILAMSAPAFAADIHPGPIARDIAYMDIETASVEVRSNILAARNEIIYGDQAWTVDGAVSIINADGTTEALPEFSELFPGWDLPTVHVTSAFDRGVNMGASTYSLNEYVNESFKVANSNMNSKAFFSFTGAGAEVGAYATTLPVTDARYNLGFSKTSTGTDLGWIPNLKEGQGCKIMANAQIGYDVRGSVSTEANAGWYMICITDDPTTIKNFLPPSKG